MCCFPGVRFGPALNACPGHELGWDAEAGAGGWGAESRPCLGEKATARTFAVGSAREAPWREPPGPDGVGNCTLC